MNLPKNSIYYYIHCDKCVQEKPDGISPCDNQKIEVGISKDKSMIQVWCNRHNENIAIYPIEDGCWQKVES